MPSHSILNKIWPPKCDLQSPVGSGPCFLLHFFTCLVPLTIVAQWPWVSIRNWKHLGLAFVVAFSLAGFPAWILQSRLLFFIQTSVSLPHWWTRPSKAFLPSSNVILWQNIAFFISFIVTKGFCNCFACSLIWILHKNGSFQRQELCPSQSTLSGIETAT